ncbi:MAG: aminoacyl-tRNA hydrolase [Anaerolineae bacterium]|jgi:PTH1 family peptidyl-tRNA hydrolase
MSRHLVVGLGNPGPKYAGNRHNVGFRCVERFASAHRLSFDRRQKRASLALGTVFQRSIILAKPCTFMNRSGQAVAAIARFYRVPLERLLVVFDDLDLPLGTMRMRPSGGSGGHRGMRSIISQVGGQGFARLRIGIGRPPGRMNPADFVLQDFSTEEEPVVDAVLERCVAAVEVWLRDGIRVAMDLHNRSL